MTNPVTNYAATLTDRFGSGWNRFWFTPSDALVLCVVRILTGLVAIYWHLSYTTDLVRWFGANGLLTVETVDRLTGASADALDALAVFHYAYRNLLQTPAQLWTAHVLGLVVLALFTAGLLTRVTSVLSLIVVLSYIHRAPMITGQLEPVLAMMIFYLCLVPAGTYLSLDRLLARSRRAKSAPREFDEPTLPAPSVAATVGARLMQVHLAALYLMMGLTKLGTETWWYGDAVWWLIARADSRLVDLTFLHTAPFLINAWTHAIVLFELSFGILIWNRLARPLLLTVAILMWGSLALLTGLVSYCVIMMVANLAFVSPESLRSCWTWCLGFRGGQEAGSQEGSDRVDETTAAV